MKYHLIINVRSYLSPLVRITDKLAIIARLSIKLLIGLPLPKVDIRGASSLIGCCVRVSACRLDVRVRRAISPTGDIEDTDYIDLLLEYKQIQQQLQSIRQQEKKVARLSGHGGGHAGGHTGAGQARRRSYSARKPVEQTGVAGRPIEISDSDNAPGDDANKGSPVNSRLVFDYRYLHFFNFTKKVQHSVIDSFICQNVKSLTWSFFINYMHLLLTK